MAKAKAMAMAVAKAEAMAKAKAQGHGHGQGHGRGRGGAALTSEERDGRAMLRSADWGASPRWAALADLYLLSAAGTVACAGPYAPSTFCELAAALCHGERCSAAAR